MDEDIKLELKAVERHIHDIGRQIGSTKVNLETLNAMSECLAMAQETLNIYIQIQTLRYS